MSDLSTPPFSVSDLDKIIHALLLWVPQDAASYAAKVGEWSSLSVEERSFNMMMSNVGVITAVRLSIAAQHVIGSATADGLTILGEGIQEGTQQILGELRGLVAEAKRAATSRASTGTSDDAKHDPPNGPSTDAKRRASTRTSDDAKRDPPNGPSKRRAVRAQPDASAAAQPAAQQEAT